MNAAKRPLRLGATVLMIVAGTALAEETGEIAYTSGGVGTSGREALMEQQSDYSLKLVFAYTNGAFLAGVPVTIADGDGNELLSAVSRGPWFLAQLPAGQYRVTAVADGTSKTATLQVPATGLVEEVMRWEPPAEGAAPRPEPAPEMPAEDAPSMMEEQPPEGQGAIEQGPPAAGLAPVEDRASMAEPAPAGRMAPVEDRAPAPADGG